MKREKLCKTIKIFLALFTLLSLVATGVFEFPARMGQINNRGGCSPLVSAEQADRLPANLVDIYLPQSDNIRLAVEQLGAMAVRSYLVARMYWAKLENYDPESLDPHEYQELLENATKAFENAEKFTELFEQSADRLSNLEEGDYLSTLSEASFDILEETNVPDGAQTHRDFSFFGMTVYAKGKDEEKKKALAWAQEVVDTANNAEGGKRMKTLAAHLGTDCKRAFIILKQANAMLAGAATEDLGDFYNTAYKTAYGLKAAGTTAGFVMAVAAAPATTTVGAVMATGGTIFSGVNTLLEVGAAGAVIYNNGEDNIVTTSCEQTASMIAPVGQVFAIADVACNVKGIFDSGKEIFKDKKIWDALRSLARPESADLADNVFGALSYVAGSLIEYNEDGKILSGTLTNTEKGIKFTLMDTLCGRNPEEKEALQQMLEEAGHDARLLAEAVEIASTYAEDPVVPSASLESSAPVLNQISDKMADKILRQNKSFDPALHQEEIEELFPVINDVLQEIFGEYEDITPPQVTEIEQTPVWDDYGISGIYEMEITSRHVTGEGEFKHYSYIYAQAFVRLYPDNSMEVEFLEHELPADERQGMLLVYEKLYGEYDPKSKTFQGKGKPTRGNPIHESRWNLDTTELTFNLDASPYTASGKILGAEIIAESGHMARSLLPDITIEMEKVRSEFSGLAPEQIYGEYHFSGFIKSEPEEDTSQSKSLEDLFKALNSGEKEIELWVGQFSPGEGGGLHLALDLSASESYEVDLVELEGSYDPLSSTAVFRDFVYENKTYDVSVKFILSEGETVHAMLSLESDGEFEGQLLGSRVP